MTKSATLLLAVQLLAWPAIAAPQTDARGCQDHQLFTRMPDFWIHGCQEKGFDTHDFPVAKGKTERIEGHMWKLNYYPQADAKVKASDIQILRNFENAIKRVGGTVVYADKGRQTLRLKKDGKEIWVDMSAEFTSKHGLYIIEKAAMAQDVVADATAFANDLKTSGHVAVYGILFDTNKSELKPESEQAIAEVAKLLEGDAGLKLFVVGHTDTVGNVDANLKLSQARAEAVMHALVRKHGVAAGRLRAFGAGAFAPVAPNDTEESRAKNRRVELVKQ
jgi:outer membrane protein OmpA-like peptidoglycan-associated protein